MATKVEDLTDSEQAWVAENVARARDLGRKYGGDPDDSTAPSLVALDAIWSTFGAHLRQSGEDPNVLINMIGLAFGQRLVDELGFSWGIVTDEYGTEIAVHGQPHDMVICPCNLIGKRWANGDDQFVAQLFTAMVADILRLRHELGRMHGH